MSSKWTSADLEWLFVDWDLKPTWSLSQIRVKIQSLRKKQGYGFVLIFKDLNPDPYAAIWKEYGSASTHIFLLEK